MQEYIDSPIRQIIFAIIILIFMVVFLKDKKKSRKFKVLYTIASVFMIILEFLGLIINGNSILIIVQLVGELILIILWLIIFKFYKKELF